jgi:hypothetical protein
MEPPFSRICGRSYHPWSFHAAFSNPVTSGCGLSASDPACRTGDEDVRPGGIVLFALGVEKAEFMARILENHVLKATARANARDSPLAGKANGPEKLLLIQILAARGDPYRLIAGNTASKISRVEIHSATAAMPDA